MITCLFESGKAAHLRHVAVTALVVENDRILLVKRAPDQSNANKYSLPGGFVEENERLKEAVSRELFEETGYTAKQIALFLINDTVYQLEEDRQNIDCIFHITIDEKLGRPDHEIQGVGWFSFDQLPPQQELAFDQLSIIQRYQEFQKNPTILPILDYVYHS